jgi:hypothetical protein
VNVVRLLNSSAKISDVQLGIITAAIQQQVENDLCPAWGIDPTGINVVAGETGSTTGDWVIRLNDETTPGDLGWHTSDGLPFGWVGIAEILSFGGGILSANANGDPSVSSVISHEVLELIVDPMAVLFEPSPSGSAQALEVADPCQGYAYQIGGVDVTDFVCPGYFLSSGPGKSDFLNRLSPGQIGEGGYACVRSAAGEISQVFGEKPPTGLWAARAGRSRRRPLVKPATSLPPSV